MENDSPYIDDNWIEGVVYWLTRPMISMLILLLFVGFVEMLALDTTSKVTFCFMLGYLVTPLVRSLHKTIINRHDQASSEIAPVWAVLTSIMIILIGEAFIRESIPDSPFASITGFVIGCSICYGSSVGTRRLLRS